MQINSGYPLLLLDLIVACYLILPNDFIIKQTENPRVGSSILSLGTNYFKGLRDFA